MEDEYDRLLAQADVFELDEETAARILEGRLKGILPGERVCRDYSPGEDELTGCLSGFRGVCLRRLPPCPGVCEKFEPGTCKRQSGKE
jgi:hypothetical protein